MSHHNNKRKLDDIRSNFTKSFIFDTISSANPGKSDLVVANLVNNHIKTNSHIFLKEPFKKSTGKVGGQSSKHALSHSQRRALGLNSLKQGEVTFSELLPLHNLWLEYMERMGSRGEDLARADLHGCFMTVVKTLSPPLLRKSGILVMESLNTFTIVDKEDKIHVLPKKGSVFSFMVGEKVTTIFGNNFIFRPGERAMKKIGKQRIVGL